MSKNTPYLMPPSLLANAIFLDKLMLRRLTEHLSSIDSASLKYLLIHWAPRGLTAKRIQTIKRRLKHELLRRAVIENATEETK